MDAFAALAVPTRRSIVELLARQGQLPATAIYKRFGATPSAISQHLKVLREAGLIKAEKRAQHRMYEIDPAAFAELETWLSNTKQLWNKRLDYLNELLKAEEMISKQHDK